MCTFELMLFLGTGRVNVFSPHHGEMSPELQEQVHKEVWLTRQRSGWTTERTLTALGVSRTAYCRWRRMALRVEEWWSKRRRM